MSTGSASFKNNLIRKKIIVRGRVQGVGFRPFVYSLATRLDLSGWVRNTTEGVSIEVEGAETKIEKFLINLKNEPPPGSLLSGIESIDLDINGESTFEIRKSIRITGENSNIVPDIATCEKCLGEIFDKDDRRYLYPFTSCTHCGPRFSIIRSMPYDRENTTMNDFNMCEKCRQEYEYHGSRRFHSQINACSSCGPQVELVNRNGVLLNEGIDALKRTCDAILSGSILAVKGIGGFHLVVNTMTPDAINRLRELKKRYKKPFAVMYPDITSVEHDCIVTGKEKQLLSSPESPIVLLKRRKTPSVIPVDSIEAISPDNPYLGVMLPYTPLHHILSAGTGAPLVTTSGNITDEPICIDNDEAVERLSAIADLFLLHNRKIQRAVDDSVVRTVDDDIFTIRASRGYAPVVLEMESSGKGMVAVGGQMKNTVAVSNGDEIVVSQHTGDLDSEEAYSVFQKNLRDLCELFEIKPDKIACDLHPSYLSTRFAEEQNCNVIPVQHHHAHVLSCMLEHRIDGPVLGVAWDGTGYGTDHTIWGGEFIQATREGFRRLGNLKTFTLPGAAIAVTEPRRSALGILYEIYGSDSFNINSSKFNINSSTLRSFGTNELKIISKMLEKKINCPVTSSAGRLFDAVSSLTGLCQHSHFQGQAAMLLEFSTGYLQTEEKYEINILGDTKTNSSGIIVDWKPLIEGLMDDLYSETDIKIISSRFHNALASAISEIAERTGHEIVVLAGGCFQNVYLLNRTIKLLREKGCRAIWNKRIPLNDGGLAAGQLFGISA